MDNTVNNSSSESVAQRKKEFRRKMRATVAAALFDRTEVANGLFRAISSVPGFDKARVVGCFVDFKNEVPTRELIPLLFRSSRDADKQIAVPYCVGRDMHFYRLIPPSVDENGAPRFADLAPSSFGILEPSHDALLRPNAAVRPEEIDLMIMPGLAFDRCGRRLGRGAGFYDKYLPLLRKDALLVAAAFDFQIVDEVPTEDHDRRVDYIATSQELIKASA